MKTFKKLSMLFLATFVLASCSDDDDAGVPPIDQPTEVSILATAMASPNLTSLVAAVEKAGLVETLSGPGPFTVLAPTNEAFAAFLTANGFATLEEVPNEALREILLNHVIGGEVLSTALAGNAGYTSTNASGPGGTKLSIYFDGNDGVTFNGTSNVATADVAATNGVIHILDGVVGLPNLLTFATVDPNFSNLASAVTDSGQEAVAAAVAGASIGNPLTVFAPVNAAFASVLAANGWATVTEVPDAALTGILLHHAVGGNTVSSQLSNDLSITMANSQNVTVAIAADNSVTLTSANGTASNVIAVDVQAVNGVYHAIDTVLLPSL